MNKYMVAALLSVASGCAFSQVSQMYMGVGAGATNINSDCAGTVSCKNTSVGGKIYGGYRFDKALAVELGYIHFGTPESSGYAQGSSSLVTVKTPAAGPTLALALTGDLAPALSGVARLGIADMTTKAEGTMAGSSYSNTDSKTAVKAYFGLGLEYAFDKNFKGTLSADFSTAEIYSQSGSVRMLSVGAQYEF